MSLQDRLEMCPDLEHPDSQGQTNPPGAVTHHMREYIYHCVLNDTFVHVVYGSGDSHCVPWEEECSESSEKGW